MTSGLASTIPSARSGRLLGAFALIVGLVAASWLIAGCSGGAKSTRGKVAKNDAIVTIECPVPDAELWVNDRFIAHTGKLRRGIALSPGEHRLELRHDRYFTHYQVIAVTARQRLALTVELAEILP